MRDGTPPNPGWSSPTGTTVKCGQNFGQVSPESRSSASESALSARAREVLQRLEGQQDKQIAVELGLSAYGVRYHIRKLFAKLGARNRVEAVRRARDMGLVPDGY